MQIFFYVFRWWKELNLAEKFPYARDRIVEAYMMAVAVSFEPQFSVSRLLFCKLIQMLALVDDTCDSYATLQEVQSFKTALERSGMPPP